MDKILDLIGRLFVAKITGAKDELVGEIHELGQSIEDNIRNGILEALEIATKPVVYIMLAAAVILFSSLIMLYGLSVIAEQYFELEGAGFAVVGLSSIVVCILVAGKASSMMKAGIRTHKKK